MSNFTNYNEDPIKGLLSKDQMLEILNFVDLIHTQSYDEFSFTNELVESFMNYISRRKYTMNALTNDVIELNNPRGLDNIPDHYIFIFSPTVDAVPTGIKIGTLGTLPVDMNNISHLASGKSYHVKIRGGVAIIANIITSIDSELNNSDLDFVSEHASNTIDDIANLHANRTLSQDFIDRVGVVHASLAEFQNNVDDYKNNESFNHYKDQFDSLSDSYVSLAEYIDILGRLKDLMNIQLTSLETSLSDVNDTESEINALNDLPKMGDETTTKIDSIGGIVSNLDANLVVKTEKEANLLSIKEALRVIFRSHGYLSNDDTTINIHGVEREIFDWGDTVERTADDDLGVIPVRITSTATTTETTFPANTLVLTINIDGVATEILLPEDIDNGAIGDILLISGDDVEKIKFTNSQSVAEMTTLTSELIANQGIVDGIYSTDFIFTESKIIGTSSVMGNGYYIGSLPEYSIGVLHKLDRFVAKKGYRLVLEYSGGMWYHLGYTNEYNRINTLRPLLSAKKNSIELANLEDIGGGLLSTVNGINTTSIELKSELLLDIQEDLYSIDTQAKKEQAIVEVTQASTLKSKMLTNKTNLETIISTTVIGDGKTLDDLRPDLDNALNTLVLSQANASQWDMTDDLLSTNVPFDELLDIDYKVDRNDAFANMEYWQGIMGDIVTLTSYWNTRFYIYTNPMNSLRADHLGLVETLSTVATEEIDSKYNDMAPITTEPSPNVINLLTEDEISKLRTLDRSFKHKSFSCAPHYVLDTNTVLGDPYYSTSSIIFIAEDNGDTFVREISSDYKGKGVGEYAAITPGLASTNTSATLLSVGKTAGNVIFNSVDVGPMSNNDRRALVDGEPYSLGETRFIRNIDISQLISGQGTVLGAKLARDSNNDIYVTLSFTDDQLTHIKVSKWDTAEVQEGSFINLSDGSSYPICDGGIVKGDNNGIDGYFISPLGTTHHTTIGGSYSPTIFTFVNGMPKFYGNAIAFNSQGAVRFFGGVATATYTPTSANNMPIPIQITKDGMLVIRNGSDEFEIFDMVNRELVYGPFEIDPDLVANPIYGNMENEESIVGYYDKKLSRQIDPYSYGMSLYTSELLQKHYEEKGRQYGF